MVGNRPRGRHGGAGGHPAIASLDSKSSQSTAALDPPIVVKLGALLTLLRSRPPLRWQACGNIVGSGTSAASGC